MMAKSAKKRQKKPRNRRARAICWLNAKDLKESSKGAFRFAPPLSLPSDQEEKNKGKARKQRGDPKTPENHGACAYELPCAKARRSAIPTLHQALGAFRWIVGRFGEGMPTNEGPAPLRLSE